MATMVVFPFIFLGLISLGTCYRCTINTYEVTCTGLQNEDLSQNLTAVVANEGDMLTLNVTKAILPTISARTFEHFASLQSLFVINSAVKSLEAGALSHLEHLQELSLNDNSLTEFDLGAALAPKNVLKTLDLSDNSLEHFADFDPSQFPKLEFVNLANNLLSHLPAGFLTLLFDDNQFYLKTDNNPWNCSHPAWSESLTERLIEVLCINRSFVVDYRRDSEPPVSVDTVESTTQSFAIVPHQETPEMKTAVTPRDGDQTSVTCEKPNCYKCSFYYCLLWLFVGIWIGIILGNICKIRHLICSKPSAFTDEYTQCEYSLVEQHMVSGIFDSRSQKLAPTIVTRHMSRFREESAL